MMYNDGNTINFGLIGEVKHYVSGNINMNADTKFSNKEREMFTMIGVPHQKVNLT